MHSGAEQRGAEEEGGRNQLAARRSCLFYRPKLIPYSINLQKCKRNDYDLTRRPHIHAVIGRFVRGARFGTQCLRQTSINYHRFFPAHIEYHGLVYALRVSVNIFLWGFHPLPLRSSARPPPSRPEASENESERTMATMLTRERSSSGSSDSDSQSPTGSPQTQDDPERLSTARTIMELLAAARTPPLLPTPARLEQPHVMPAPLRRIQKKTDFVLPPIQWLRFKEAAVSSARREYGSGNSDTTSPPPSTPSAPIPTARVVIANKGAVTPRSSLLLPKNETTFSPSEQQSQATSKKPTVTVNTSRKRQKDELVRLRVQVQELQHELEHLKARVAPSPPQAVLHLSVLAASANAATAMSTTAPATGSGSSSRVWQRIAMHQKEEKTKAEVENIKLKGLLQDQMKLSKGLEKILKKRCKQPNDQQQGNGAATKRLCLAPTDETAIYKNLEHNLAARVDQIHLVVEASRPSWASTDSLFARVVMDARKGHRLELSESKVFPFAVSNINEAIWQSLESETREPVSSDAPASMNTLILQRTLDTLSAKTSLPLGHVKDEESELSIRIVFKRFVDRNRVLLLWEAVAKCQLSPPRNGFDEVEICESGWGAIEPLASGEDEFSSIVQLCSHISPKFPDHGRSREETDGVAELLIQSYRHLWVARQQRLENYLMESALGFRTAPVKTEAGC